MYKLFLTFRYLTRKKIVIFPILVVWLCLMMMIIVTSIMGGFVDHVRQSNRDLLGDIIISNRSPAGWARYDEMQTFLKSKYPEIVASTPTIQAYGLLTARTTGGEETEGVQIVGVDPVGRSKVSKFRETLFEQYISPMNAVADMSRYLPATGAALTAAMDKHRSAAEALATTAADRYWKAHDEALDHGKAPAASLNYWALWGLLVVGGGAIWILRKKRTGWRWAGAGVVIVVGLGVIGVLMAWPLIFPMSLTNAGDAAQQAAIEANRANRSGMFAASLEAGHTYRSRDELIKTLLPPEPSFAVPKDPFASPALRPEGSSTAAATTSAPGDDDDKQLGCIAGSYVLLGPRDKQGHFFRSAQPHRTPVKLTVVPIGAGGAVHGISANTLPFSLVDDAYTGVYDVDSTYIYAPFDVIQSMAEMRTDEDVIPKGSPRWTPPRCNELLIKLKPGVTDEQMATMRARMQQSVEEFQSIHPDVYESPLLVQTWFEKQEKYLAAVQNEKNMMTFILGLMSLVVVVVIFLIFYMIVRDKTRDIGIIKAVGGSEEGVAGIFLTYGLFVGIVGGVLGVVCGVAFVTHTNQIHEWIYHLTGVIIWDRSVYVFDSIPDTVNPVEVASYFVAALISGVLGSLIPALVAGSEDPVKAVRYE